MKDIHELKLHETETVQGGYLCITRVPGGWIYMSVLDCGLGGVRPSSVFVPYNDEFTPVWKIVACPKCGFAHHMQLADLQKLRQIKCASLSCPIVFDNPEYIPE